MRPLTATQLRKCKCFRCGAQAEYQWSACADENVWRPLCKDCDFALNVIVIRWMGFADWRSKLREYAKTLGIKWTAKAAAHLPEGEYHE